MSKAQLLVGTSRKTVFRVLGSNAASQLVSALANLLVLPRVLHGIGVRQYGEWATLAALVAIGQLAQTGAGTEIARRVAAAQGQRDGAALRDAVRQGVTVLAGIAALIEAVTIVFAHPVVVLIFSTVPAGQLDQLSLLLIGVITVFSVGLVGNGYFSVLSGLQRSDYSSWSGVVSLVVGAGVTLGGIAAGWGLWSLLASAGVQLLVSWAGPVAGVRRVVPGLGFRLVRVSKAVVVGFVGLPAMLVIASASDLFDSQVDKLVLAHTVGPRASAMFQIGVGLEQMLRSVALIPLAVMLAGTAELYRTDPRRLRRLELLSSSTTQALAAVGAGGVVIFASQFIQLWLGHGYGDAALAARALALSALLNMWSAPWTYYAVGRRRYHYVLIAASATLAVNALCTVFLTTRIGLAGALIGSVAGSAAGTTVGRLILWRWERRAWLWPAVRASGTVALLVVPVLLVGPAVPATWEGILTRGLLYVAACGVLLVVTRSLPFQVVFAPGHAVPRLALRQVSGLPKA